METTYLELSEKTPAELRSMAEELEIKDADRLKKHDLMMNIIIKSQGEDDGLHHRYGVLDILPDKRGYLRTNGYAPDPDRDVYVAETQIKRFGLRTGDTVSGPVRPPKENERYHSLLRVETINGMECAKITTNVTGKLHGTRSQSGMDFVTDATIEGTDTWYFAYEKGIYVKSSSGGTAEGTIKDAMGQGINIPMTREFSMTLELVKMR